MAATLGTLLIVRIHVWMSQVLGNDFSNKCSVSVLQSVWYMFLCTTAFCYHLLNTLTTTEYICALLPCVSSFSLNVLRAKELNPFFLVCYVRLCSVFLLALGVLSIFYIVSAHLKLKFPNCIGTLRWNFFQINFSSNRYSFS